MHLCPEFGLAYQQVEADGFTIDAKVEMLLSSEIIYLFWRITTLAIIVINGFL